MPSLNPEELLTDWAEGAEPVLTESLPVEAVDAGITELEDEAGVLLG